jgi:hypothetical protein
MLEMMIALIVGIVGGRALDLYRNRKSAAVEAEEEISVTEVKSE